MYIKKSQRNLIICLSVILLLSIGYALFSDNITITGTAKAKGTFALSTTCTMGFSEDISNYTGMEQNEMQHGYADESCVPSDNTVTMKTSLLYPGASRYFTVTITNTGSMDAVLPLGDEGGSQYEISQMLTLYNIDGSSTGLTYGSSNLGFYEIARDYAYFVRFGDGTAMLAKNANGEVSMDPNEIGMMVKDSSGNSYFRLKPGESAIVMILVQWSEDATDKTKTSEVTGTLTLLFTQAALDLEDTTEGKFCFNGC